MSWCPAWAALGLALLAPGCAKPPAPQPRAVLGQPYQLGGLWSYPAERFDLTETGLAVVLPDRRATRLATNGEVFDPARLLGAHRTLQLPAIVTVLNLENGRELRVRVIDRGPTPPGRILGLSRRAGELLGVPDGGAAQIRLTVDPEPSRALVQALPNDYRRALAVATAPTAAVERETLAPLPGAAVATPARPAPPASRPASAAPDAVAGLPPDPLPEQVAQRGAQPGQLILELGTFFRRDLAQRQAARLAGEGARAEPVNGAQGPQWRVRAGPFGTVAAADAAVQAALRAGLPEVALRVE